MGRASERLLVGRKIVEFDSRPFPDGRGGTAHNPRIVLDNGAVLVFITEECDAAEPYGTRIVYIPPKRRVR